MSDELRALLEKGRVDGAYTHASLCVVRDGEILRQVETPGEQLVFDIASVTKAVTAATVLRLLPLAHRVEWIPGAPAVGELLSHSSGLPAWRPLFAHAAKMLGIPVSQLVNDGAMQQEARRRYRELIAQTARDAARPTYSDLGFLALGFELEDQFHESLANLLGPTLFPGEAEMGSISPDPLRTAATGKGRPRAGNPPVESSLVRAAGIEPEAVDRGPDDDNAACGGWICGHAGIFTTSEVVARFGDRLRLDAESGGPARHMFTRVSGTRTHGLDTPSGDSPAIGTILGRGPKGAAGHLGFTGCSLWIDRDAKLSIAFLTNAVLLARPSPKIKAFRPLVHDAVARSLGL